MISCTAWVRRGVAAEQPQTYAMDDAEFSRIQELAQRELAEARGDLADARALGCQDEDYDSAMEGSDVDQDADEVSEAGSRSSDADHENENEIGSDQVTPIAEDEDPEAAFIREYGLDDYDEGEGEADEDSAEKDLSLFHNLSANLAVFASNDDDPYVTVKDNSEEAREEEDDIRVDPSADCMILCGKTEENLSHLEVYVYAPADDHLYVHHDILLPSFPLCVESVSAPVGASEGRNFCAVGTFESEIEIWNLDVLDVMYPHTILGRKQDAQGEPAVKLGKKSKKGKGKKAASASDVPEQAHTAAVMGLSWNRMATNLLASSSADHTVKLWDLNELKCVHDYRHHKDKVAAVQFHPTEASVLLTAAYDQRAVVLDARSPSDLLKWRLDSDVECVKWNPHSPSHFLVSMESGTVQYFDVRQPKTAVFTLAAHTTACSAVDFNPFIPGMLVTGSGDRTVKVWDLADGGRASMVSSRDLTAGKVFSVGFSLDSPYHCVVGGSKGELTVWNITDDAGVRKTFEGREAPAGVVRMDGIGSLHALNAGLPVDETNASKSSMSLRKSKQAEEDEEDEEEDDTMEQVLQEMSGVALGGSGSKN